MADSERPLFSGLQAELASLVSDIREMVLLRWELARLELKADARTVARLAVVLGVTLLMVLTALPLLISALCSLLDGFLRISQSGWLLIFALLLIATAAVGGFLAWRRFRRDFIALEETLEELHEDILWLREWQEGAAISDKEKSLS